MTPLIDPNEAKNLETHVAACSQRWQSALGEMARNTEATEKLAIALEDHTRKEWRLYAIFGVVIGLEVATNPQILTVLDVLF